MDLLAKKKYTTKLIYIILLVLTIQISGCTQQTQTSDLTGAAVHSTEQDNKIYMLSVTDIIFKQMNLYATTKFEPENFNELQCVRMKANIKDTEENYDRLISLNVPHSFIENHEQVKSFIENNYNALRAMYRGCELYADDDTWVALDYFKESLTYVKTAHDIYDKKITIWLVGIEKKYPEEFNVLSDKYRWYD